MCIAGLLTKTGTGSQQKVLSKLGKLEEHRGLELQWNTECMGNKFELFICMTQSPVQQRKVQSLDSFSS